jgi:MbtH protein
MQRGATIPFFSLYTFHTRDTLAICAEIALIDFRHIGLDFSPTTLSGDPFSLAHERRSGMFDDPEREFQVLINDEGQNSSWPTSHQCPEGWTAVGVKGVKADCVAHIDKVWDDMRPVSLRRAMELEEITS